MVEAILKSTQTIRSVSGPAAIEYEKKQDVLRQYIDQRLLVHEQLRQILGSNPVQLLLDNHKYHARFMSNVFQLNSYVLLVRIVVWVYRSYHRQGIAYDYFPWELKQWMEAVRQELSEAAAQEILPVYAWMLSQHDNFVSAAEGQQQVPFDFNFEPGSVSQFCLDKLIEGDYEVFAELAVRFVETSKKLDGLYVGVLQPCLYEIGKLWEHGKISVAQEHLASAMVSRAMFKAFEKCTYSPHRRGKVVIAASPNEYHEIGTHMVADLLELAGWDVLYLGANTPQNALLDLARMEKPFFIGVSAVMPFNIDYVKEIVTAMRRDSELQAVKIMVGGLAFSHVADLWRTTGADGYAPNGTACLELARQWWEQAYVIEGK